MGLTLEVLEDHGAVYGPGEGADLPGVVILHGAEGPMAGWAHRFAAILAAHGCLALPWGYGEGDVWGAGPIRDVDIAGVPRAIAALAAHPRCRDAGLFGWSKGGELALLTAVLAEGVGRPAFVAAHAASDLVRGAFDPEAFRSGTGQGHDRDGPRAWVLAGAEAALTPGAAIAIETYDGPVFLSAGSADEVADPAMTGRLAERCRAAGRPAEVFIAEGQGHALGFDVEPQLWARLLDFIGRAV